ncbi:chromosome segregation protein SMC [Thermincola potens]|uniref:Chromosome partition protein Smc n=1 Tax=Thermincola potens (strain JR) TaxID=635013 RepID=D5X8N2_THEPJ|nr:chromosome segregation protein SMC [Thermincola potens]ADG82908.1 chromosome segregation protein SMC [Thermincola potens JR]
MYLKRLEIQGFKSLADRTELYFNPGITAVVGPNGSGKSNISDAIRWVLGEQSAKILRGAKMEDVIFSGSDKRKPVGMAEVTLTLDNSTGIFPVEYSEVTVTRRVFRSGESEFFINKTPCRLKDIHELFMDTGIGKEGYSIIGQGKIDEILSSKSEDRRLIIEEAAGIVKYKNRKLQAARKLEDTEQNMVRINDIIAELENQVGPLEEQANRAKTYIGYKEELDKLEINLAVHQLTDQKDRLETLTGEEAKLRQDIIALETEVRKTDSEIEELKHHLHLTNEDINNLQQDIFEKSSAIEKLEADIRINGERNKNLKERQERLQAEINELSGKQAAIREQSRGEMESYEKLVHNIRTMETELAELEAQLRELEADNRSKIDDIEQAKGEIIDTLNETAALNNRLHALEAEEKSLQKRREQLVTLIKDVSADRQQILATLESLNISIRETEDELSSAETKIKDIAAKINENSVKIQDVTREFNNLTEEKQKLASKLKALEEMEQDYEGYHKGVREILKAGKQKKLAGICGVVAELLNVPKKYEIAVEVALGGALQFIVTRTDNDAKAAINFLRKCNAGRATFLPLNTVKAKELRSSDKILKAKGCVGIAAELVTFDREYEPAVKSLLGNIIVAEDIDTALQIAKDNEFGFKVVTLDGDVVNPGGSLTGGSYNKSRSNLLGRKREIEELAGAIAVLQVQVKAVQDKEAALQKEKEKLTGELESIKESQQVGQLRIAGLKAEMEQVKIQKSKLEQSLEVYEMEVAQLDERLKEVLTQNGEITGKIQQLKIRHDELNKRVAESQQDFASLEVHRNEVTGKVTAKKIELARLRQEEISCRQTLDRVRQEIDELAGQIRVKSEEIDFIGRQEGNIAVENSKLEKLITTLVEEKMGMEERISALKNHRDHLAGQIELKETSAKNANRQFASLQNQIHSLEVKKTKLEAEMENEQNKLLEEFGLTYEEALLQKTEISSKREAQARIKELKSLIADLGAVNLAAIEEFEKVSERYNFLKAQYADLEEARVSLYKVISEMDQIMSKRFCKAYEEINENFRRVFTELFGGGHAELQMTDKENILETGVEIIAQPPGKKPQHLSLLSGGERALTAISLLFAVLMVKPSPFCVLDEIEASLDEANVDRYAAFLRKFSKQTQFIVVTHRKGTMEAADVLYGVTIDDTGVSKMVSMKLADAISKVS